VNRIDLIDKLMTKPQEIHAAEVAVLEAQAASQDAQRALETRESELLQSDAIDGKNAEIRKAQLQLMTTAERAALFQAVRAEGLARVNLTRLQNEFHSLRAVSRLMAGEVA
jgi:hypothetical protein